MGARATIVGLAALAAVLAGCGGSSSGPPEERPDDFALEFSYMAGSVPPPYHDEWELEVEEDGEGTVAYTPDYPADGVPVYRESIDVEASDLDELYESLRSRDLLRGEFEGEGDDEPVGGSVTSATVQAGGESYEIPDFAAGEPVLDDETVERIRKLVPAAQWRSFLDRRDAYALREYDQEP